MKKKIQNKTTSNTTQFQRFFYWATKDVQERITAFTVRRTIELRNSDMSMAEAESHFYIDLGDFIDDLVPIYVEVIEEKIREHFDNEERFNDMVSVVVDLANKIRKWQRKMEWGITIYRICDGVLENLFE